MVAVLSFFLLVDKRESLCFLDPIEYHLLQFLLLLALIVITALWPHELVKGFFSGLRAGETLEGAPAQGGSPCC